MCVQWVIAHPTSTKHTYRLRSPTGMLTVSTLTDLLTHTHTHTHTHTLTHTHTHSHIHAHIHTDIHTDRLHVHNQDDKTKHTHSRWRVLTLTHAYNVRLASLESSVDMRTIVTTHTHILHVLHVRTCCLARYSLTTYTWDYLLIHTHTYLYIVWLTIVHACLRLKLVQKCVPSIQELHVAPGT